MTNVFPELFEDEHLKGFSKSIQALAEARNEQEVERAGKAGFAAAGSVPDVQVRENAKRRLKMMESAARERLKHNP